MADSYRASLVVDGAAEAPRSVVVKLPSTDTTSRSTALGLRAYEKEVRFYQHLAPQLEVRAPRCFHAEIDVATADFVLVLADLHPATQGDQLTGCRVEVAASALDQLVALHAPSWGQPIGEHEDWLVGDRSLAREVSLMILPGLWQGFVDRYGSQLDATVLRAGEVLFTQLEGYLDTGDAVLAVVHGDFRLDNLLIDDDRSEVMGVVDWQTATQAPALRDVAYMLGAGLLPEVRREAERGLVEGYHAGLADAGVADLTWPACWEGYRRGTWAGLVMAVGASMMVVRTDRGDEMFRAMAHRHALHALDLGADELLAG
jgi:aminoglycoside/choline kinase family phosphotransferase